VIEQAGEWAELDPAFVGNVERRKPLLDRMLGVFVDPNSIPVGAAQPQGRSLPGDAELRELIRSVLTAIAHEGSVVIVSHAGSFALTGRDVLRVFVTASEETRTQRIAAAKGLELREATRRLKQEDAARADYLRRFYGVEVELPTHFDLVVNTDRLTPDELTGVIVTAVG
jgi:hypothetical protein